MQLTRQTFLYFSGNFLHRQNGLFVRDIRICTLAILAIDQLPFSAQTKTILTLLYFGVHSKISPRCTFKADIANLNGHQPTSQLFLLIYAKILRCNILVWQNPKLSAGLLSKYSRTSIS